LAGVDVRATSSRNATRIGAAVNLLSYQLYQDRHQPEGVHIELGPGGLSIQGNKSK
jgi:hypothetical protein